MVSGTMIALVAGSAIVRRFQSGFVATSLDTKLDHPGNTAAGMDQDKRLILNTASNLTALAFSAVIGFLLALYILRHLGASLSA